MQRTYALLSLAVVASAVAQADDVTFNKDVAPILFQHCVACHRPGNIAPMSLLSYKAARQWAAGLQAAVVLHKMPPWHADPSIGHFANDARLSDCDIAVIDAWAKSGAREGDPADLPKPPAFKQMWHIQPDVI